MIPHLLRCQGLAVKNLRLRPWTPWIWGILGFCNTRVKYVIFSLGLILFSPTHLFSAEKLTIGVAANFILPFKVLAQAFAQKYSIAADATFTSSGNLYSQIIHGAPYDLFLSADKESPNKLFQNGLAEKPFIYAKGKVVLWGLHKDLCRAGSWKDALMLPSLKRISIANPQTAPYGSASVIAIQAAGLWPVVENRLVFAQTVAQAFQYAHTGTVSAGFCAYSSVLSEEGSKGCSLLIDQAPDILQAACILKRTQIRNAAGAFAAFLISPEAVGIIKKYGYQ